MSDDSWDSDELDPGLLLDRYLEKRAQRTQEIGELLRKHREENLLTLTAELNKVTSEDLEDDEEADGLISKVETKDHLKSPSDRSTSEIEPPIVPTFAYTLPVYEEVEDPTPTRAVIDSALDLELRVQSNIPIYIQKLSSLLTFSEELEASAAKKEGSSQYKTLQKDLSSTVLSLLRTRISNVIPTIASARPLQVTMNWNEKIPKEIFAERVIASHQKRLMAWNSTAIIQQESLEYYEKRLKSVHTQRYNEYQLVLTNMQKSQFEDGEVHSYLTECPSSIELSPSNIEDQLKRSFSNDQYVGSLSITGPLRIECLTEVSKLLERIAEQRTLLYLHLKDIQQKQLQSPLSHLISQSPLISVSLQACGLIDMDLETFGLNRSLTLLSLDLSQNELTRLRGTQLPVNLVELDISSNSITELQLEGLPRLQTVKANNNRLVSVPSITSTPLLTTLYFNNNNIQELDLGSMGSAPNLLMLYVMQNGLHRIFSSIPVVVFDSLEMLMLEGNPLDELHLDSVWCPRLQAIRTSIVSTSHLFNSFVSCSHNFPSLRSLASSAPDATLLDAEKLLALSSLFPSLSQLGQQQITPKPVQDRLYLYDRAHNSVCANPHAVYLRNNICTIFNRRLDKLQQLNCQGIRATRSSALSIALRGVKRPKAGVTPLQCIRHLFSKLSGQVSTVGMDPGDTAQMLAYIFQVVSGAPESVPPTLHLSNPLILTLTRLSSMLRRSNEVLCLAPRDTPCAIICNPSFVARSAEFYRQNRIGILLKRLLLRRRLYAVFETVMVSLSVVQSAAKARALVGMHRRASEEQERQRRLSDAIGMVTLAVRSRREQYQYMQERARKKEELLKLEDAIAQASKNVRALFAKRTVFSVVRSVSIIQKHMRDGAARRKASLERTRARVTDFLNQHAFDDDDSLLLDLELDWVNKESKELDDFDLTEIHKLLATQLPKQATPTIPMTKLPGSRDKRPTHTMPMGVPVKTTPQVLPNITNSCTPTAATNVPTTDNSQVLDASQSSQSVTQSKLSPSKLLECAKRDGWNFQQEKTARAYMQFKMRHTKLQKGTKQKTATERYNDFVRRKRG
ncbi:Leucine-rich repeat protein [Giardia muris]|uniref:Leucine-rich repeat protein n=1 Tax=Giardia muris TaxID=5742 RepID=A0A4Z1SWD4_GIAMU|nr:Leucine-rich repeat protein [Giardia muris]|eukprot:TNJ30132.1 Leucine-rich repeat protein [Giardia muris]